MYIFILIFIVLVIWVLYTTETRYKLKKRSFYLDFSNIKNESSVVERIGVYVLYLSSGSRFFINNETSKDINVTPSVYIQKEVDIHGELICESQGDSLNLIYTPNTGNKEKIDAEELYLEVFSLPKTNKNQELVEKYLKEGGWKINERRMVGTDNFYFSKGNINVSVSYIS